MTSARRYIICVSVVVLGLAVSGCSSQSDADEAVAEKNAETLVAATQAAGVAPRLTPEIAESLYGTDAPALCDVFDGGLSTSARNVVLGNPAHGRRKTITDNAVTYGGLVVETYCPEFLDDYDEVVAELDPFDADVRGGSDS